MLRDGSAWAGLSTKKFTGMSRPDVGRTVPKGSALGRAALAARRYRGAKFKDLEGRLRTALTAISPGIGVHLLAEAALPEVWPPADVLITLPMNADGTGVDLASG